MDTPPAPATREALDAAVAGLVGRSVRAVHYQQLDGEDPAVHDAVRDFADFAVVLELDDGMTAEIAWDGTFYQYGLTLHRHAPGVPVEVGVAHDRTDQPPWPGLLGVPITRASVVWWRWNADMPAFPQAFLLHFGTRTPGPRRVLFSAAQPSDTAPAGLFPLSDWIAVLHDGAVIDAHLATFT